MRLAIGSSLLLVLAACETRTKLDTPEPPATAIATGAPGAALLPLADRTAPQVVQPAPEASAPEPPSQAPSP
jgi:hypothetical protein